MEKKTAWKDSHLAGTKFGPSWVGEDVTPESLRGKVVLIEHWGYKSAPCIKEMSRLISLQKEHGRKGLVVIAMHAQGTSAAVKARILRLCKKKRVNYIVTAGGSVPGRKDQAIPNVQLLGPSGYMWFQGNLSDSRLTSAIKGALKKVKSEKEVECLVRAEKIMGDQTYGSQPAAVKQIQEGKLGESYNTLLGKKKHDPTRPDYRRRRRNNAKGQISADAKALLKGLDTYAKHMFSEAERMKKEQPSQTMATLKKIATLFAATPYSQQANDETKKLTSDKEFQKHLSCERRYLSAMKVVERIGALPKKERDRRIFIRKQQPLIHEFAVKVKSLIKYDPDSIFVNKLTDQLTVYGVKLKKSR